LRSGTIAAKGGGSARNFGLKKPVSISASYDHIFVRGARKERRREDYMGLACG